MLLLLLIIWYCIWSKGIINLYCCTRTIRLCNFDYTVFLFLSEKGCNTADNIFGRISLTWQISDLRCGKTSSSGSGTNVSSSVFVLKL